MNAYEKEMLELLVKGKNKYGIVAVKAEFEAEGTRTDELLRLLEVARRADVMVALKIGGCEAVRDLCEARQFGVDYIIAPMVETPYAFGKFVAARDKAIPAAECADIRFLFNVETKTTFDSLASLAALASKQKIGMVFGRVDFAGSLGKDRSFVNGSEMTHFVELVAMTVRTYNIDFVVGGSVSPASIEVLRHIRSIRLDRFETRKVVFDASILETKRVEEGLALAIEFELLWLKNKREYYRSIAGEDEVRIAMMEARSATAAPVRTPLRASA